MLSLLTVRRLSLTAAVLFLSRSAGAQIEPGSEPDSLGPLGGSAVDIVVNPLDPQEILVVRYTEGLFRSTDGGATFVPYGAGIPADLRDLKRNPNQPQGLLALAGKQIYASSNFGAQWSPLSLVAPETLKALALPASGDDILAIDAFNVHHSPDGGLSWSIAAAVVPFAGQVFDSLAYAADGSRAYVGSFNGIWRSVDGGLSFSAPVPTFTQWTQCVTVHPGNPQVVYAGTPFNGLFRSTNGGLDFSPIGAGVTSGNAEWFGWEPLGGLWYATLSSLYHSSDAIGNWTVATAGWPINTPIPAAFAVDSSGVRYLGCEGGGLYDQSGGGLYRMPAGVPTSWQHIGFLVALIRDVAIASPGGLRVIGIGSGVYAAAPGQTPTPTAWHADIGTTTNAVAVDPLDPTRWVTGGVGAFFDNAQIVVMTGSGTSFAKTYESYGSGEVTDIAFDPFQSNVVLAGMFPGGFGNEALTRSTDGGDHWVDVPGTAGWATRAIAFDPIHPGYVIQLSDNNQWAGSTNGGASWTTLQPAWPGTGPGVLLAFDPFTSSRLFRGDAGQGLWRSDDYGANWNPLGVSLHQQSDLVFHPTQPDLLWVSDAAGKVLVSDDGGASFQVALDVPLGANASALALDTLDGTMIVGTTAAAAWQLVGASPVVQLGAGTLGSGAYVPVLTLGGGLPQLGNSNFSLRGTNTVGGSAAFLGLGFTLQPFPVAGGVYYPGNPLWYARPTGGIPGAAGGGSFTVQLPLPLSPTLIGVEVATQYGVLDSGAPDPSGIALSNALLLELHD